MIKTGSTPTALVIQSPAISKALLIYRAIYHPLRLKIVNTIYKSNSINVTKLHRKLKGDKSLLSQQLKILRDANIVVTAREGKQVFYSVNNEQIDKLSTLSAKMAVPPTNKPLAISGKELKAIKEHVQKPKEIKFTKTELQIIKLICEQKTNEEIGDKLKLSKRTVEGYRQRIIEKMKMRNTVGLVLYAVKNGMYSLH